MNSKATDRIKYLQSLIPENGVYTSRTFDTGKTEICEDLETRLKTLAELKNFAVNELGLEHSINYIKYETEEPRTYSILHVLPNEGFYKKKKRIHRKAKDGPTLKNPACPIVITSFEHDLIEEKIWYELEGLDVNYRTVKNFNDHMGCDLTEEFVKSDITYQAETLFHEDWHWSIRKWQGEINLNINESAATIIGYYGMADYMIAKYGRVSAGAVCALEEIRRMKRYSKAIVQAYKQLKKIDLDRTLDNKERQKAKNMCLKKTKYRLTPAQVLESYPYRKHSEIMLKAHSLLGSTREFIEFMSECPAEEKEALTYIEQVTGC